MMIPAHGTGPLATVAAKALQTAMQRSDLRNQTSSERDAKSLRLSRLVASDNCKSVDQFKARCPGLRDNGPKVQAMAEALVDWCARVLANDRTGPCLLVLAGDTGTGKTRCLNAANAWLMRAYITAWEFGQWDAPITWESVDWPDLCLDQERDNDQEQVQDVMEAGVALIDDIGSEVDRYKSGMHTELLRRVLGRRERRFTLVTTNVKPVDWTSRWDIRVADRLMRRSVVVDTFGVPSYSTRL